GLDAALRRRDSGCLLIRGRRRLLFLTLGCRARLRQLGVGLLVERGDLIGRLLACKLRLRGGEIRLRLLDAALGVDLGLLGLELRLPELLFEHRDLVARDLRARILLRERSARGLFTRPHLLVVEYGDRVAGLDAITLVHAHFEDAAARLRRYRGIVR